MVRPGPVAPCCSRISTRIGCISTVAGDPVKGTGATASIVRRLSQIWSTRSGSCQVVEDAHAGGGRGHGIERAGDVGERDRRVDLLRDLECGDRAEGDRDHHAQRTQCDHGAREGGVALTHRADAPVGRQHVEAHDGVRQAASAVAGTVRARGDRTGNGDVQERRERLECASVRVQELRDLGIPHARRHGHRGVPEARLAFEPPPRRRGCRLCRRSG